MINNISNHLTIIRIYDEMNWALTKLHSSKDTIKPFDYITNDIIQLINKEQITFSDLSIRGLNEHHAINVAILNALIGKMINIENIYDLVLGGLLHDIGKSYIPKNILNKKDKLSTKDKEIISQHSEIGYNLIKELSNNKNLLNIIRNHHKIIKNLPKPLNIKEAKYNKEMIYPLICGISDITDAMLSFRTYKQPLTIKETKEELTKLGIMNIEEIFKVIL